MEMSQSDPVTEWNSSGGQTGLEEPMWQLGFGGGLESYPQRPDEADCIYYLRTGFCGYGSRCRFNHPRDRGSVVVGSMRSTGGEYPERIGQPVCQYYMRTGMCKFGGSCKYHHPRQGVGSSSTTVALNISGYPLRPGEKECSYYVKTGQCKFGVTCKFHHPQPVGVLPSPPQPPPPPPPESLSSMASATYPSMQSPVASSQPYGVFTGNWPVARPPLLPPGSYTYGPPMLLPFPGWNPYQGPVSPNTQTNIGAGQIYAITPHLPPSYTGSYLSMPPLSKKDGFPERPGEPECQYYLKTGDCKFGSSCRYHHPPEWTLPKSNFMLSPMGLPIRPGAPLCSHYAQKGVCKFGPSCKFDHPMGGGSLSYSPSASSLADMPVAPYPVGSSIGTLAPSSSSSELRPEAISGTNKDGLSTSMPSGSVGSSLSKSMPLSKSTGGDPNAT